MKISKNLINHVYISLVFPDDGLSSTNMNLNPGGKSSRMMRSTSYQGKDQIRHFQVGDTVLTSVSPTTVLKNVITGEILEERVIIKVDDVIEPGCPLIGVSKGILQVLHERGLPLPSIPISKCTRKEYRREMKKLGIVGVTGEEEECSCGECILGDEVDFKNQKSSLEILFNEYPYQQCLFLPKFHPELNFIERIWGRMKFIFRNEFIHGTGGREGFIQYIKQIGDIPNDLISRYFMTSMKYFHAYHVGMDCLEAHSHVKKNKSHRSYSLGLDAIISEQEV